MTTPGAINFDVSQANRLDNQGTQISYFVGTNANEVFPQTLLTGDRNVKPTAASTTAVPAATVGTFTLTVATGLADTGWTQDQHQNSGNIGLADGSAQQATPQVLQKQMGAHMISMGTTTLKIQVP